MPVDKPIQRSSRSQALRIDNDARRQQRVATTSAAALKCRRKFLRTFPSGFRDETYLAWERDYKWDAHRRWDAALNPKDFKSLLRHREYSRIAAHAVAIEARTNLIFSFEKMALRDAVKSRAGAQLFAEGLYDLLHGPGAVERRFGRWCEAVADLPRKQTRVLTWPIVTVFGFIAQPHRHIFLKPNVTRAAASEYGYAFLYRARPAWEVYTGFLAFARLVRNDLADMRPRDMIDIQSFLWVLGSDEYAD